MTCTAEVLASLGDPLPIWTLTASTRSRCTISNRTRQHWASVGCPTSLAELRTRHVTVTWSVWLEGAGSKDPTKPWEWANLTQQSIECGIVCSVLLYYFFGGLV
jgi:hypothetical protein